MLRPAYFLPTPFTNLPCFRDVGQDILCGARDCKIACFGVLLDYWNRQAPGIHGKIWGKI